VFLRCLEVFFCFFRGSGFWMGTSRCLKKNRSRHTEKGALLHIIGPLLCITPLPAPLYCLQYCAINFPYDLLAIAIKYWQYLVRAKLSLPSSLRVKHVQQAHNPTLCYKRKSKAAHSTPHCPCSSSTRVELASSYMADVSQRRKAGLREARHSPCSTRYLCRARRWQRSRCGATRRRRARLHTRHATSLSLALRM